MKLVIEQRKTVENNLFFLPPIGYVICVVNLVNSIIVEETRKKVTVIKLLISK